MDSLTNRAMVSELDWVDEELRSDLEKFCVDNKAELVEAEECLYIDIHPDLAEAAHTNAIPFLHRTVPFYGLTSALDRIINPPKNRNQLTATYDGGKTVHHYNFMAGRWSS